MWHEDEWWVPLSTVRAVLGYAALAETPGEEDDDAHYPGCTGNPCRCAGTTVKPDRPDFREYLIANFMDGDASGRITVDAKVLADEMADLVAEWNRLAVPASEVALPLRAVTGTFLHRAWLASGRPDPLLDADAWDGFGLTLQALARVELLTRAAPAPGLPDDLRALSEAATPVPWRASGTTIWRPENPDDPTDFSGEAVAYVPTLNDEFDSDDPPFIAAAVNYVREALAREGGTENG